MFDMWADLAPILLAMMISPARTLALIILLHTPQSTRTALGYVTGMVIAMIVQGAGLAALMGLVGLTAGDRSGDLAVFIGTLFLLGGVILLAGAFKFATASGSGSLGSLLERLETIEPAGALRIGFGWIFASPKQWVFVLTAVAVIVAADLSVVASLANYGVFTLLVQLVYFVIIGAYLVARERVDPVLDGLFGWIRGHLKPTAVGLFTVFGCIFVAKGLTSLG